MFRIAILALLSFGLSLGLGFGLSPGSTAVANPIPVPTLLMMEEEIAVRVYIAAGQPWAIVEGRYPFSNVGYESVRMYYPVPPDATEIQVWCDREPLEWHYVTCACAGPKTYPTAIGDYRMITWELRPVPQEFTIGVRYKHQIPQYDGQFWFLYALGTGRFLDYYGKETTAHVRIWFELGLGGLEAFIGQEPTGYRLEELGGATLLELTAESAPFRPLEEDLLIKFTRRLSVVEAVDTDGDRRISDAEIRQALCYWLDDAPVPGTAGARINDLMLFYLARLWASGGVYVLTPYQARDRAIEYLSTQGCCPPEGAIWEAEPAGPEGLVGATAVRYRCPPWTITVSAPVVPFPDYDVQVEDASSGRAWELRVRSTGEVLEG